MVQHTLRRMVMGLMLVTLSLAAAVVSANAQSSRFQMANVPFDFVIGDQDLPSGSYEVSQITSGGGVVQVKQREGSKSAIRLSSLIVKTNPAERSKLVFHRYGNTYFLAEVWGAGYTNGRKLIKSSREDSLKIELARNSEKYERVEIALARN